MGSQPNVLTIGLSSLDEMQARLSAAFRGEPQGCRYSFLTTESMWSTLAPKRMQIVKTLTGAGPLAIREIARRVGRDVKGVHSDVTRLVKSGVINRTEAGKIEFPYDAIHVDFMMHKAA